MIKISKRYIDYMYYYVIQYVITSFNCVIYVPSLTPWLIYTIT